MQKIGAWFAIAALTAATFSPLPAAAFGLSLGPLHLGLPLPVPFFGSRHRHSPNPMTGLHDEATPGTVEQAQTPNSTLLYPVLTAPSVFDDVFWPSSSSPWPFNYQAIFQTAFAKAAPDQDAQLCQQPNRINGIVERIQSEIKPAGAQARQLQMLGGALNMAAGYLAKTCPDKDPVQPVARLQLMEWQVEKVAEALDIVRQPLQAFEQSLNVAQRKRFDSMTAAGGRTERSGNIATDCVATPTAIDWSTDQISTAVQPSDAQRNAVADLKQAFSSAASELDASCPTTLPPSPLARLQATEGRLDATWRAVVSIQVALANFESGLSDEQRTRFDATDFAAAQ